MKGVHLKTGLIFFYLAVFTSVADASDCSPIDLRNVGESMEGIDPVIQGHTNMCFAYSASAMLDAWRQSERGGILQIQERTVPAALAIDRALAVNAPVWFPIQNTTDPLSDIGLRWGGMVCPLIRQANRTGLCTALAFADPHSSLESASFPNLAFDIYQVLYRYARQKPKVRRALLQITAEQVHRELSGGVSQGRSPASTVIPSLDAIKSVLQRHARKPYRAIRDLMFQSCAQARTELSLTPHCRTEAYVSPGQLGFQKIDFLKTKRALKRIHDRLELPRATPPAMAYCARVLFDGYAFKPKSILSKKCRAHWSLIIGRKRIGDRCHFLVRNTWDPEGTSARSVVWPRDAINDIWVDEAMILKSIAALSWID